MKEAVQSAPKNGAAQNGLGRNGADGLAPSAKLAGAGLSSRSFTLAYDTCAFQNSEQESLEEVLQHFASLGFGGATLNLHRRHLHPHEHDEARIDEIRALTESLKLKTVLATDCSYVWSGVRNDPSPICDHPSQRRMWLQFHLDALDLAARLGAECLTLKAAPVPVAWLFGQIAIERRLCLQIQAKEALARQRSLSGGDHLPLGELLVSSGAMQKGAVAEVLAEQKRRVDAAWTWLSESVRRLCERASELGVKVGVDFAPATLLASPADFLRFRERVDHPALGLTLDVCTAVCADRDRSPEDLLAELAPHAVHVRLSDARRRVRSSLPLGEGDIDCDLVLSVLERANYAGQVAVHYRPSSQGSGSSSGQHFRRSPWELAERAWGLLTGVVA